MVDGINALINTVKLNNIIEWINDEAETQSGLKLVSNTDSDIFFNKKNSEEIENKFIEIFGEIEGPKKYDTMRQYVYAYKRLNNKLKDKNELNDLSADLCMLYIEDPKSVNDEDFRRFSARYPFDKNKNNAKEYTKFLDIALAKIPQELRNSIPQLVKEYKKYVFEKDPNLSERNSEAIYIKIDWDVIKNAFNKKYNKNLDIATLRICYYNYLVGGRRSNHRNEKEIVKIFKDQNEYLFNNIAINNGCITFYSPNIENYNIVAYEVLKRFNQTQQQQAREERQMNYQQRLAFERQRGQEIGTQTGRQ